MYMSLKNMTTQNVSNCIFAFPASTSTLSERRYNFIFNFPNALMLTRRPYTASYISPLHPYLGPLQEFPTFTAYISRITTDLKWIAKFSESLSNIISMELACFFTLYQAPHEIDEVSVPNRFFKSMLKSFFLISCSQNFSVLWVSVLLSICVFVNFTERKTTAT